LLEECAVAFAPLLAPAELLPSLLCSVSVNSALPSVQHLLVVVLFGLNASLVLEFGQLGGPLLVHHLLELAAHGAVALTNLSKDVSLVHLLHHACLNHLLIVSLVLAFDLLFHV
jgi:hypothetical protein